MKKKLALALATVMMLGVCAGCGPKDTPSTSGSGNISSSQSVASELKAAVFYYNFADPYITTVRTAMDKELKELGIEHQNFDAQTNQGLQTDQVNTAITDGYNLLIINVVDNAAPDAAQAMVNAAKEKGIPVILFNREVDNSVIESYDKAAFVGTDAPEAGHMQGKMVGDYLIKNWDAVDLNKDGKISYVMFKGQEGNAEAEARTQFGVEDANKVLEENGKPALEFYDSKNTQKYLVDTNGAWSSQAATDYMSVIMGEYNDANNNMVELVIANNDGMALGAITALQEKGYNKDGAHVVPVFGVDAIDDAKVKISEGSLAGTIMQDADGLATAIAEIISGVQGGASLKDAAAGIKDERISADPECATKVYVAYAPYTGE